MGFRSILRLILATLFLLGLWTCGGSGGSSSAHSNWDQLIWDRDNWS